jgi:hypothetical protein
MTFFILQVRVCGDLTAVEQHNACYLPEPRDGRGPLLGPIPGVTGAFIASGHSCWGILQVQLLIWMLLFFEKIYKVQ